MAATPDARYELAYTIASTAIAGQRDRLSNLRTRAATLLSAASIVTAFLGTQALDDRRPFQGLQAWELVAVILFAATALLSIAILLPWPGWMFRISSRDVIRDYVEAKPKVSLDTIHRDLALHLENHYEANEERIEWLFWCFRIASLLLAGEVVAWMIDLT